MVVQTVYHVMKCSMYTLNEVKCLYWAPTYPRDDELNSNEINEKAFNWANQQRKTEPIFYSQHE